MIASPTYYSVEARFRGQAAHAGIRPEAGHNAIAAAARAIAAMRIGRLDAETTANVGRIEGGTAANVVAERCYVELETRSLDAERAAEMVSEMVDALGEAASDSECDVETSVERLFQGYRLPRTAPAVEVAAAALRDNEIEPSYITTGGGSDANVFIPAGPAGREPRQRHGAQPPARRVGDGRGARDDARGDALARAAGGAGGGPDDARRLMERIGGEVVWEGRIDRGPRRPLPLRRRRGGRARDRRAPGRGGGRGARRRARLPGAPAARGGGRARRCSSCPAGKLDEEGESPLDTAQRELAEEIGKGARTWQHLTSFYTSPGFTDEECHLFMATDLYDETAEADENERIEIVEVPLAELDQRDPGLPRREDARRACSGCGRS